MHFEILVEDVSGKKALNILIPKIIGEEHTFTVHSYKGIGKIPGNLKSPAEAHKRILLAQLPNLLRGYGKTFAQYPPVSPAALIVVCDLDDKCLHAFRLELLTLLEQCHPKPNARFCIAIEEGEAWFLGDLPAVKAAYPHADNSVLCRYENDSICGTWEQLADAVFPGGAKKLISQGWQAVGLEKSTWAETISPHMNVELNRSSSFNYFRKTLLELAEMPT